MAAPVIHGRLELVGVSASGLPDVRFLGTMSPALSIEVANVRRASAEAKGAGKTPKWNHAFPAWELTNVPASMDVLIDIADDASAVARTHLPLAKLIQLGQEALAHGADQSVHLALESAKDAGKMKGEVVIKVIFTPARLAAAPAPKPAAQTAAAKQPQQQLQQQQQIPAASAPVVVAQPIQMYGNVPQHMQQQQQMQQAPVGYAPQQQQQFPQYAQQQPAPYAQPAQPFYPQAQPPHLMQQQPVVYAQGVAYSQPVAQPMYSPTGQPFGQQPQQYPQPVFSAQPAFGYPQQPQQLVYAQSSYAAPAAPFVPQSSSADGVFPFSELTITRIIGEGTFGTVSAGEFRSTPVAIKQLKQSAFTPQQWEEFMSEVKFLREARHPNIVLFMGVSFNPYCIVTELLDTSLFAVLHTQRRQLTLQQQLHIALAIGRGIASLHAQPVPIVHRDIKSLNVLVSNDLVQVKVCDLGMVKLKAQAGQRLESNGTPLWMAPEVLLDQPYDEQADVYSYGCVLFELLTASIPFGGGNISKQDLALRVGHKGERPILPHGMNPQFKAVLVSCWQHHPLARPKMKQIVATLAAIKL